MATSAQLLDRTRQLLGEATADFYSDADDLYPTLNWAMRRLVVDAKALPAELTAINGVADTRGYDLPSDFGKMLWLRYDGNDLLPIWAPELESLDQSFFDTSSTPTFYSVDFMDADGDPQINLWPAPASNSTGAMTGFYYRVTPAISGSQDPEWHEDFHFSVCYGAASECLREDHRQESGDRFMAMFEQEIRRYRKFLNDQRPLRHNVARRRSEDGVAIPMGRLPGQYAWQPYVGW